MKPTAVRDFSMRPCRACRSSGAFKVHQVWPVRTSPAARHQNSLCHILAHIHKQKGSRLVTRIFPFDLAWDVDNQTLASNIFATSIFPYAGFLYHLQKSKKAPRLMLFGFYFLLVFVLATIVAGIYAKIQYNSILANVDWLHGTAESFLTLTNLFIVLGLRQGIQDAEKARLADEAKED